MEYEMETKNMTSMFESMRLKNLELEEKIKQKGALISESEQ